MTHSKNTPLWLVVGAGAIGLLWASKLRQLNHEVHLVQRTTAKTTATIHYIGTERYKLRVETRQPDQLNRPYQNVLFCTKIYDLVDAYCAIQTKLTPTADLVCLCNGMGAQTELAKRLTPQQRLFVGITSEGAMKIAPYSVRKTGHGQTFIGQIPPIPPLQRPIPAPLDNHEAYNIEYLQCLKLAVNAVINPLTALNKLQNGALLNSEWQETVKQACAELAMFFQSYAQEKSFRLDYDVILSTVMDVAQKTANNRSSMLEDITHNRRTEIDYISGFIVDHASRLGVETPIQADFLARLKHKPI